MTRNYQEYFILLCSGSFKLLLWSCAYIFFFKIQLLEFTKNGLFYTDFGKKTGSIVGFLGWFSLLMSGSVLKLKLLHSLCSELETVGKTAKTNGGEHTSIFTSFQKIFLFLIKKR